MGVIKRGILGGFKGSVANVVGSSWKGISTMRSKPLSVANPRTAAQVNNRSRFAGCSTFASTLLTGIVKPLWDRFAVQMSGYNSFCLSNKAAFDTDGFLIWADLIISKGKLGATVHTPNWFSAGNQVKIHYATAPEGQYQMLSDKAYAVCCTEFGEILAVSSGVSDRANGEVIFTLNRPSVAGEYLITYLAFLRADGTLAGDTSVLRTVVTA